MAKGLTSMFGTGQLCGMTTYDLVRFKLLANRKANGPSHNYISTLKTLYDQYADYSGPTPVPITFVTTQCSTYQ